LEGAALSAPKYLGHDGACPSKSGSAHEKDGDHAAEKCQERDGGDSEDDEMCRIARCRFLPER
jgi:hypothetical protein